MGNDYNPQNPMGLLEREDRLRMRSKGGWAGNRKFKDGNQAGLWAACGALSELGVVS